MTKQKGKATLHDVAEAAGVSIATVSRAINNKDTVKPPTYKRIMAAIRDVGYEKYTILHHSGLLLVLLPDLKNPFYSEVIKGITSAAERHGYQEIIVRTGSHPLTFDFVENLVNTTSAEGVITLDPIESEMLKQMCAKFPVVQCAECNETAHASCVTIDDVSASELVVDYIVSKGITRIALLNGPMKYKYARKRQEGFIKGLKKHHIEIDPYLIAPLPQFSYDAAVSLSTQLLTTGSPPKAIFAVSDVFAVAAINAAKRLGLKIPQDLAVVGFDNTETSIMCSPPLTTVKQPQFQMGFLASEMLIEQIKDPNIETKQIMLNTELIIRESI